MISIKKKKLSFINKIILILSAVYCLYILGFKTYEYFEIVYQKNILSQEISVIKDEKNTLKDKVSTVKKDIKDIENNYLTQKELETKVNNIFERMSILDYEINLIGLKKMCIDRYVLITQVYSESEKGQSAAEGILSYLGNMKKSDDYEYVYFVDYISPGKRSK